MNLKHELCRNCNKEVKPLFVGNMLKTNISYFECSACGYVQTESPHWLEQAYADAINDSDTGIMLRNQANARIVLATLMVLGKLDGSVVDCAGGYGILVRLLRDFGVNAVWSDRYCQNLLAKGFEHANEKAELVTAFEAFEHFVNPSEELDRLLATAPNVLFSTQLIADPAPKPDEWWYYGQEHGQHIGFFRLRTLEIMAQERGKHLVSDGVSRHLMTDEYVNPTLWKILVRANKYLPFLTKRKLVTKVWSDHEQMTGIKK